MGLNGTFRPWRPQEAEAKEHFTGHQAQCLIDKNAHKGRVIEALAFELATARNIDYYNEGVSERTTTQEVIDEINGMLEAQDAEAQASEVK